MGATTFATTSRGTTMTAAFKAAREAAANEYGHGGYTGSIAEKDTAVQVADGPMAPAAANDLAHELIDNDDPRVNDKYGPAGAILLDDGRWLFFGWASE